LPRFATDVLFVLLGVPVTHYSSQGVKAPLSENSR